MRIYIPLFVFVILSFVVIRFSPFFDVKVQADGEAPVVVDFMFDKVKISTEKYSDKVMLYTRLRVTDMNPEVTLGDIQSVRIVNDTTCVGSDCSLKEGDTGSSLTLMTEGCSAAELPEGFNVTGLVGCGDSRDGIYSAGFFFNQGSPVGDWQVYEVKLYVEGLKDGEGNDLDPEFSMAISDLKITTVAGEKSVVFTNLSKEDDPVGPELKGYAFDKASIDTTNNTESLTMYIRLSDNLSGVNTELRGYTSIGTILFEPAASGNNLGFVNLGDTVEFKFTPMKDGCESLPSALPTDLAYGLTGCGNSLDGIYSATVEIPRYSTGGIWSTTEIWSVRDLVGNEMTSKAISASFNNTSTKFDTDAPRLKAITITPDTFDTTNGPQTVRIEMQIEDDMAGVDIKESGLANGLRSVTSVYDGYWSDSESGVLKEGTVKNGTFVKEIIIPKGATKGFWAVGSVDVVDVLGRARRYTMTDLSLAFPDLPLYLVNQGTSEQVEISSDWSLADWPYFEEDKVVWPDIEVRFKAGTVITKEKGGVFAFHRLLATKYNLGSTTSSGVSALLDGVNSDYKKNLEACDPTEGCLESTVSKKNLVGAPLHMIKMGVPGLNLSFSKPVTIIVGTEEKYLGSTFVIQSFDEVKNEWVNHGSCTVAMVEPPSRDSGGDAFGGFKPIPYPGCSFTTDHASFFSTNVLGVEITNDEAGVPNTGIGGLVNSPLAKYFKWLR